MGCRWLEAILAVVIIVFAYWPTVVVSQQTSTWIVIVSAALLLLHALFCMKCKGVCSGLLSGSRSRKRR